ncbi:MAG: glycosyl hydrolase, partial [Pontibacter sp.]|nr:glycosyl hydrolase [Pontibacter sp.]
MLLFLSGRPALAIPDSSYVSASKVAGSFALSVAGKPAPLYVSSSDHAGVIRAAKDLQADINRVTGAVPQLTVDKRASKAKQLVLIGTLGKSPLIDKLVKSKKLNVDG